MSVNESEHGASAGKRAWWTATLLGVGVLVNYFDRVNLAVAQGAMQREWGVGNIGFGYLSSAYSWTYAAMQLPAGWLLDRFGVWAVGSRGGAVVECGEFRRGGGSGTAEFFLEPAAAGGGGGSDVSGEREGGGGVVSCGKAGAADGDL